MKKKAPCYKCIDRKAGCHAGCERYTAWSKERIAQSNEVYDAKQKVSKTYPANASKSKRNRMGET